MASENKSEAQRIRASLKHPVIDADGHWLEFGPIIVEQLEKFGGSRAVEGFRAFNGRVSKRLTSSEDDRKRRRRAQEAVQEAMDRRDNGGDAATATEN